MKTLALPSVADIDSLDSRRFIIIKNARVNNLKNLSVAIPRNQLIVITGLSGSGKSSLAFDTLFAEGQRMYVESLSSYARQFLGRMEKPDVDYIRGVSPAIAIEQKVSTKNPRSTVGTTTEIYDYLKLLYARIGRTYSPVSGNPVKRDTVTDVVDWLHTLPEGSRFMVLAPLQIPKGRKLDDELKVLLQKGFTRIVAGKETFFIEELLDDEHTGERKALEKKEIKILIDRNTVQLAQEDNRFRIADSVQTAFYEGHDICEIRLPTENGWDTRLFSDKFELDGITFEEPTVNLFTFNNPYGACKRCEGFGKVLGIDPDLVIPDKTLSVYEGAIAPWRSDKMNEEWHLPLIKNGIRFDFPIHRAYQDLTEKERNLLWTGNSYFRGLNDFFENVEEQTYKIQYRVMLSRYRGKTTCPECKGTRLRQDAQYVKVANTSITDIVLMPIDKAYEFFKNLQLPEHEEQVAHRLLIEITNRLEYMVKVGLGYLSLNRLTSTLSGGEYQRIRLATSLGSALVGSMYILDEPSIGLHPRDTQQLVEVLKTLRDLGNTVIVVEHEEEVMRAADQIIDIGPEAGAGGGHLVFQGIQADMTPDMDSHTVRFLLGTDEVPIPKFRRKPLHFITVKGVRENNLQNLTVKFPLGVLCVVTGVSGSGKSTLVREVLYPALAKRLGQFSNEESGKFDSLEGDLNRIAQLEMIDQNPIGKSSRSNPISYIKAYDYLRNLFSELPLAKARAYKPAHFSFNVDGGRCEVCQGEGVTTIEMQFMADIQLLCESCHGKRFKQDILEVVYNEKSIADVLAMTVDESITFFKSEPKLVEKLLPLQKVGLGYVQLGQSATTLSGGEAQRVKLASFLGKGIHNQGKTLFIFDEPTTGLHFHDIKKLLTAINALVEQGDSVIIIEHNMEIIKCADWIIDLGPEGGENGGKVTFEGTPEAMVKIKNNYTADFLRGKV
jgi:excinuclease ABC subunit A